MEQRIQRWLNEEVKVMSPYFGLNGDLEMPKLCLWAYVSKDCTRDLYTGDFIGPRTISIGFRTREDDIETERIIRVISSHELMHYLHCMKIGVDEFARVYDGVFLILRKLTRKAQIGEDIANTAHLIYFEKLGKKCELLRLEKKIGGNKGIFELAKIKDKKRHLETLLGLLE